jgi:hypothetical protein
MRRIEPGEAEVRYPLHPSEWAGPLAVRIASEQPLPGVLVEAWLEARVRR